MSKVILRLDELSCPSCMTKIEAAVSGQSGVKSAKVLFNASKVKAEFDECLVSAEELKELLENLGYPVQSMKVIENIEVGA